MRPLKRSLAKKVRGLGILQVTLIAVIMTLMGALFFRKLVVDENAFEEGAKRVKADEAEGIAKLVALELGRIDALRFARSPNAERAVREVRAVLWEKVTFLAVVDELDLVSVGADGDVLCLRPIDRPVGCEGMSGFELVMSRYNDIHRLERLDDHQYAMPLYVAGAYWGVIHLEMSESTVQYTLQELSHSNARDKTVFIVLLLLCLAGASTAISFALLSFFKRMHQPLLSLTEQAQAFGEQPELGAASIVADPEDEIGVLVRRFDEMRQRLVETFGELRQTVAEREQAIQEMEEKDELLRRSERLASVGVLAAGVAHEIGNKLNPMGFVVHNIQRRLDKGRPIDAKQVELLSRSIDSCAHILDKLRSTARGVDEAMAPISLDDVISDVMTMLVAQTSSRGVVLSQHLGDGVPLVRGNRGELVQVLINLVVNARDAIDVSRTDGTVQIMTRVDTEGCAVLEVIDNGSGMSEDVKARVFEPFFSTKGLSTGGGRGGTGLGLYICYGILSRHGVEPVIESLVGTGTQFILTFPPLTSEEVV